MKYPRLFLVFWLLPVWAASAAPQQNHDAIRETALAYAQAQTRTMPGKVSIRLANLDRRTQLAACDSLEAFMPSGAKLVGNTSIGVRCGQKPGWSVFLQATIKVTADMLVANRPLAQGWVLGPNDFGVQSGELGQPGILTEPAQAVGRTLKFAIGAGQVLRLDMLRPDLIIRQGQTVSLQLRASGFSIGSSGQAMNDAAEGQAVRVKVASGQLVSAIATKDGHAEIRQ